jgi:hypothetical protein
VPQIGKYYGVGLGSSGRGNTKKLVIVLMQDKFRLKIFCVKPEIPVSWITC